MSEYYGVSTPSENFLTHYGIKGMHWGIRKAIASGNRARLASHYARASKKLQTLTARSDKELVGRAKKENLKSTIATTIGSGLVSGGLTYGINPELSKADRLKYAAIAGGIGAGASAIAGGINQARLARWGSKRGNAKLKAKRAEWEKEMRKAFKGTPYAKQIDRTKSNINKNIRLSKRISDPSRSSGYSSYRKRHN